MGDHFDLSGKVAVITGGSRGLGREMAMAFAAHGADVVIASRKADACAAVAAEIAATTRRTAIAQPCHVGRWEDCERLAAAVFERFGQADILVNNAGMSPLYPALSQVSEELYDKVLAVNLKGPFRLSALFGERMAAGRGGSIINISSIAAVSPSPLEIPYAMAKAGLNNLTVGLARTLAPKVRVNCIMPGAFLTDIAKAWDVEAVSQYARDTFPLRRLGEAKEIVGAALYLASDASSYTTGSILKVDGGATSTVGGG